VLGIQASMTNMSSNLDPEMSNIRYFGQDFYPKMKNSHTFK
jgi:hypothetical protein